jgi:hypothetical protein
MFQRKSKIKDIEAFYKQSFDSLLNAFYQIDEMSGIEIALKFLKESGIKLTPRAIQRRLNELGISRDKKDSFRLAIKKGRMDYSHLRKPIKSNELRKGISLKKRYLVLKRGNFRCAMCGKTAKDDLLVIDHIKPVTDNGDNDIDNLQVLCRECNHGKMIAEERH